MARTSSAPTCSSPSVACRHRRKVCGAALRAAPRAATDLVPHTTPQQRAPSSDSSSWGGPDVLATASPHDEQLVPSIGALLTVLPLQQQHGDGSDQGELSTANIPEQQQQQQQMWQAGRDSGQPEVLSAGDPLAAQQQVGPQQQQRHGSSQQQQRLQRCTHWRQLLPLAAMGSPQQQQQQLPWLLMLVSKALQLQPHQQQQQPPGLGLDSQLREQQQHDRFVARLLRAAAGLQPGPANAASLPAAELQQLLCRLARWCSSSSHRRELLLQQLQLAAMLEQRVPLWSAAEAAAVLQGLAALNPPQLQTQQALQQRLLQAVLGPSDSSNTAASQDHVAPLPLLSQALWAAGRMSWQPQPQLLRQAAVQLLLQIHSCSAAELAMSLWGLAKMRLTAQQMQQAWTRHHKQQRRQQQQQLLHVQQQRPPPPVAVMLSCALLQQVSSFSPQELVRLLWTVATLRVPLPDAQRFSAAWLVAVCKPPVLLQLADGDISSLLWSLVHLQHQQQQQQKQQLPPAAGSQQQHQHQHEQRLAPAAGSQQQQQLTLVAAAQVQPLLQAVLATLPGSHNRFVARSLWSVAALGLKPPVHWVAGVLRHLQSQLHELTGADLLLLADGMLRLRFMPQKQWVKRFWLATLPLVVAAPHPQPQPDSSSSSSLGPAPFTHAQLTMLVAVALRISRMQSQPSAGQKPPAVWLEAMASASTGLLGPETHLNSLLLWGQAMLRFSRLAGEPWQGPGAAWWQRFEAATQPHLSAAGPHQLLALGHVLTHQRQHSVVGGTWAHAFVAAAGRACLSSSQPLRASSELRRVGTSKRRQAVSGSNLAQLAELVAALGGVPGRDWVDAWDLAVDRARAAAAGDVKRARARLRGASLRGGGGGGDGGATQRQMQGGAAAGGLDE